MKEFVIQQTEDCTGSEGGDFLNSLLPKSLGGDNPCYEDATPAPAVVPQDYNVQEVAPIQQAPIIAPVVEGPTGSEGTTSIQSANQNGLCPDGTWGYDIDGNPSTMECIVESPSQIAPAQVYEAQPAASPAQNGYIPQASPNAHEGVQEPISDTEAALLYGGGGSVVALFFIVGISILTTKYMRRKG